MDSDSSPNTTTVSGTKWIELPQTSQGVTITQVKRSVWFAHCADVTWNPREGHEPNWFHRKMQEFCFGIKWRKK